MKAIRDVYDKLTGWAPIAVTSTKTSGAIDLANVIENEIILTPGLWTDGTHTPTLTYSGTAGGAGTYTTCAAGDLVGSFSVISSTATAQSPQAVSYIGPYQYVKLVDTVVGGTTGAILGVMANVKYRKQP